MTEPLDEGLELLERALAYTRGCLLDVTPAHLHRPTPCRDWDLDQLLAHMDDALDAFTEGATGAIAVDTGPPGWGLEARVSRLQAKACGLLGAWATPGTPVTVDVGHVAVATAVVVRAAALEITVHGWDVARTTRLGGSVPEDLAARLRPVASALVSPYDRPVRFADPVRVAPHQGHAAHLLAYLGRGPRTGPPPRVSGIRRTAGAPAS